MEWWEKLFPKNLIKGGPKMDAGPYPSCNVFILPGMVSGSGTLPA